MFPSIPVHDACILKVWQSEECLTQNVNTISTWINTCCRPITGEVRSLSSKTHHNKHNKHWEIHNQKSNLALHTLWSSSFRGICQQVFSDISSPIIPGSLEKGLVVTCLTAVWYIQDIHCRIITFAPFHTNTSSLNLYRLDALPDAQPTVLERWRQWQCWNYRESGLYSQRSTKQQTRQCAQCGPMSTWTTWELIRTHTHNSMQCNNYYAPL